MRFAEFFASFLPDPGEVAGIARAPNFASFGAICQLQRRGDDDLAALSLQLQRFYFCQFALTDFVLITRS